MTTGEETSSPARNRAAFRHLPWVLGLLILFPLLANHRLFSRLFWFGDEFGLFDVIDQIGVFRWIWQPVDVNFMPLFKGVWVALALAGGGSYGVMVWAVWLTHALNVALLARWMLRSGFGFCATAFVAAGFGLSTVNIETLTWAMCLVTQLSLLFFLVCALDGLDPGTTTLSGPRAVRMALWSLASAWCFSRGVLTGVVVAIMTLFRPSAGSWRRRTAVAGLCLLPSVVTVILIVKLAPDYNGGMLSDPSRWGRAVAFGAWYLAGSPSIPFWGFTHAGWNMLSPTSAAVAAAGAAKLAVILLGWILAKPPQRRMLSALLLLDVGNACLLGFGRSNGDLHLALSSRYQYISLVCTLPFLAVLIDRLLAVIGRTHRLAAIFSAMAILAASAWWADVGWARWMPGWVEWRGMGSRRLLLEAKPVPEGHDIEGLHYISNSRAKELVDKYNLH